MTPIEFYQDGQVSRIALDQSVQVPTPAGPLPAELLLFHRDGSLKRVFPTNGKLNDLWTLEDEQRLVPRLRVRTPVGEIAARFISIAFHPGGSLRSVTLWPGDRVAVQTPIGRVDVRQGLSFRRDGSLESLEPARPIVVDTPLGRMEAFDPQPIGLNADANSLGFGPDGEVAALTTVRDIVTVMLADGSPRRFVPSVSANDCADSCATGEVVKLRFESDTITLRVGPTRETHPIANASLERRDDGRRHLPCLG